MESLLTHGSDPDLKQKARTIAEHSSPAKATRYARFSVHLLSQHPPTTPIILDILDICLSRSSGDAKAAGEVKAIVFQAACVKDLYLTEKGDEYRHGEPTLKLVETACRTVADKSSSLELGPAPQRLERRGQLTRGALLVQAHSSAQEAKEVQPAAGQYTAWRQSA